MVHATDSFTVGCDTGFPILPLFQSIRQLTVHSWVWLRPEERADLVMCLKDILLRWLRVSFPGREIFTLIKGREQGQKEGFLYY